MHRCSTLFTTSGAIMLHAHKTGCNLMPQSVLNNAQHCYFANSGSSFLYRAALSKGSAMTESQTFEALLKVVVIGDSAVGKTCLILRYTQDLFRENFLSTIGVDFKTKTVEVNEKRYKLQVWDTAGQERYNTIRKGFYRGAKGVVVVYDITNPDSFAHLSKWVHDITANCADGSDKPVIMILGNKIDLEEDRRVSTDIAMQAAHEFDTLFAEVSAKTGSGIDKSLDDMVERMVRVYEEKESTNFTDTSIRLTHSTIEESHRCAC